MKILISAYECNPYNGSDAYVGWSWAKQLAETNEVYVLTHTRNQFDIESYLKTERIKAKFYYIQNPAWIGRVISGRKGYFLDYLLWQETAYRIAINIEKIQNIDIVHHVSIADFRVIGKLWKLKASFFYGPVGGGQETPIVLYPYIKKYWVKEKARSILNHIAMLSPNYRKALKKASRIYISNDETIDFIKRYHPNYNMMQLCELGIDSKYLESKAHIVHSKGDMIHILVAGRLMYRKGVEMLLDAVALINTNKKFVVDIYGGGHQILDVENKIKDLGLESKVLMHGKVDYLTMQKIYEQSDIVALPSLRETTGTTVIEAMANKLPVVALNQNGVKYLIGQDAGYLTDIGSTMDETLSLYAEGLKRLIEDDALRIQLGNQAYEKLKECHTWEKKVARMCQEYQKVINK